MDEVYWKSKWSRDQIKAILLEQFETFWRYDTGTVRTQLVEIERAGSSPHAVIISGLRRAGKSTLLAQMAHRLGQEAFYYLNFEDDRFISFQAGDFTDNPAFPKHREIQTFHGISVIRVYYFRAHGKYIFNLKMSQHRCDKITVYPHIVVHADNDIVFCVLHTDIYWHDTVSGIGSKCFEPHAWKIFLDEARTSIDTTVINDQYFILLATLFHQPG